MNFVCYAVLGGARVVVGKADVDVIFDEKDG